MSSRMRSLVAVALAAGFAVACSDSPTAPTSSTPTPTTPSFSRFQDAGEYDAAGNRADRHVHELRDAAGGARNARRGGGSSTGISYHGGPVLQAATNVVAVYWAASPIFTNGPTPGTSGDGSADNSLVGYFLGNLGGSPYFNINTTYTDGSGHGINNVVNYTRYWANNSSVPSNGQKVSDANMVAMLQSGFNSGALTYDGSTVYAIFTAGTVNLGGGFGTQYCAYHTHGTVKINGVSKTVLYAAMPYNAAYPSACTNGTAPPNGDAGADAEVNTLAHEIEETTTDMMGNAWYDNRGYENADKCAWTWGTTRTVNGGVANIQVGSRWFLVQENWINSGSGGCRQSY